MSQLHLEADIAEIADRVKDEAAALAGKRILLTGGGGFLGRYFVAVFSRLNQTRLKRKPCKVAVADNLITSAGTPPPRLPPGFRFLKRDVVKPMRLDGPVDFIIHAAGIASPYYYRAFPLETLEVATVGTKNMLVLAKEKGARVLYFSSSEIYGDPDPKHVPTSESYRGSVSCRGPRACYDESKRLGETLCGIFHEKGVPLTIVRPFNVYGPGMAEADYRVLPNWASRMKAGQPVRLYGTGRQTRTFTYVTDALTGFIKALVRGVPGEAYNIGNPKPEVSMVDLVGWFEKATGKPLPHVKVEYPDSYPGDEPNRRCPDIKKARVQLGFEPVVALDEGLKRFLGWADKNYRGKN